MLTLLLHLLSAPAWAVPADQPLADQPFTARPSGFLIPTFTVTRPDPDAQEFDSGFRLNAHLGAEAQLDLGSAGQMGALIELNMSPTPTLKDGFAIYRPARFLRFDIGQFKVPYSLAFLASDTRRLMPVVPLGLSGMVARDVGVMVTASLPVKGVTLGTLQLAAFNGAGPNHVDDRDGAYLYALRGVITPFGARTKPFEGSDGSLYLGVGGAWVHNRASVAARGSPENQLGGELQFAWTLLSLQGELLCADREDIASGDSVNGAFGGYGTLSVFVPLPVLKDHVQLVGRFGQSRLDEQPAVPTREWSGGLNLYWFPAPGPFNDVKLQVAYLHYAELEGAATPNDAFTSSATVRF